MPYKEKNCDFCGKQFAPQSARQKRCSVECMKRAEQELTSSRNKNKGIDFLEKKRNASRMWRIKNPDRVKSNSRAYREKTCKEKASQYHKAWREQNKEKIKSNHLRWRTENRQVVNEKAREARKSEDRKAKARAYSARRSEVDGVYKLSRVLRGRIKQALLKQSVNKNQKTFELLGMTGVEFMQYLLHHPRNDQGVFTKDNYGSVWVVDHIRPIASYDITDKSQCEAAFHFSNCQPMTHKENAEKGCYWNGFWWKDGKPYKRPLVEEYRKLVRAS